jgi:hypothetical protein
VFGQYQDLRFTSSWAGVFKDSGDTTYKQNLAKQRPYQFTNRGVEISIPISRSGAPANAQLTSFRAMLLKEYKLTLNCWVDGTRGPKKPKATMIHLQNRDGRWQRVDYRNLNLVTKVRSSGGWLGPLGRVGLREIFIPKNCSDGATK